MSISNQIDVAAQQLGAPSTDQAWREACSHAHSAWAPWSHKCVYWAATWAGVTDPAETEADAKQEFEQECCRALEQADSLADAPSGQNKSIPTKDSKTAEEHLQALRELTRSWGR